MQPEKGVETCKFLLDAKSFILGFRSVIDSTPLQLYSSALVFAPQRSLIQNTFQNIMSSGLVTKPTMGDGWSPCLQTLESHSDAVRSVAFSANSQLLASGSSDRTIKIWDTATGREIQTLEGHDDSVCSVAFSQDSKILASGSSDGGVKIWDSSTWKEIR